MSAIKPIYFGRDQSLFGIFHAAEGVRRNHAVVIAGPRLNEYMRSHAALRQIAVRLAGDGFDVFRFDYSGMGNSQGTTDQVHIGDWVSDLESASEEAIRCAGVSRLSAIAVRFGAYLIAAVGREREFEKIVFWDPIFSGPDWHQMLEVAQGFVLSHYSPSLLQPSGEIMGHAVGEDFVTDLMSKSPLEPNCGTCAAVTTNGYPWQKDLTGIVQDRTQVDFSCGWEYMTSQVLYPHDVVDTICKEFQ
jgi:pimeloyl-ACP methyl ester carboxylesterase